MGIKQRNPSFLVISSTIGCLPVLLDVIIAVAIIVAGASYTAVVIPFAIAVLYFLQMFYLRTSRQMWFLDLEAKSPLYTHFAETLAGAVTVRAFGLETAALDGHRRRLDLSQKPYYLMCCIQRWLNLVLDLVVAGIAVVLVSFALLFGGEKGTINVPNEWPSKGEIQINGVVASYSDDLEPALRSVTLDIKPGSKVAICGRTGSGKSSILLTLLPLLILRHGILYIDNLNLSHIPFSTLRTRLACLHQDPISLPGSVCSNLCPLASDNDPPSETELIFALTKAHIWHVVSARGGIDADFSSLDLSPGQKQLFCLAAAALRKSKVVLLDEVTGSVDFETDVKVRTILEEEFRECTVLAVVHRSKW
ncbi:hypothetical protein MFIFM68171_02776 [Madurella fahalii]|uniref:ABC transmembrane type-1 domain-containing protein n=1 Tax=Madurella fahalii TaxID=1157608 RepID=A0ABQ0G4A2_9PEZI